MRYLGGKARQSKAWASFVLEAAIRLDKTTYLEPFMGLGLMMQRVGHAFDRVIGGDTLEDVILMFQGAMDGTFIPPETITKDLYNEQISETAPSALRGYVLTQGSFRGKWRGGHAAGRGWEGRFKASSRDLISYAANLKKMRAELHALDYQAWSSQVNSSWLIYADPPYEGQTAPGSRELFSNAIYRDTLDVWVANGAAVFHSEYGAEPYDSAAWTPIHEGAWSVPKGASFTSSRPSRGETLWLDNSSSKQ